jgi:hypothetical protein
MIRVAMGFLLIMGAVGYDEMMIEMSQPQPLTPLLLKALLGIALISWGLYDMANRGELDDYR